MKYEIKTQQGDNYIVSDDSAWLWIQLERDLGYTFTQAQEKVGTGSLEVITYVLYKASVMAGHTELKMHQTWVETIFDTFDVVMDDPKAISPEVSSET